VDHLPHVPPQDFVTSYGRENLKGAHRPLDYGGRFKRLLEVRALAVMQDAFILHLISWLSIQVGEVVISEVAYDFVCRTGPFGVQGPFGVRRS
jgi:hypothetical protein